MLQRSSAVSSVLYSFCFVLVMLYPSEPDITERTRAFRYVTVAGVVTRCRQNNLGSMKDL